MFGFGNKKIIGIDIGFSSLKLVELEARSQKPRLTNYAWMPIADILEKSNIPRAVFFETEASNYLREISKQAEFKTKDAYVSIPSFGGLITLIDFPAMPIKDMDQAVKFEAHKYIPTAMDDVVTSWELVNPDDFDPKGNPKSPRIQVVLVAASKNKIQKYEKIVKDAGFNVAGIEMENFSLATALVGKDNGNFIIVDIGFRLCNVIYVGKGIIKANRNIDAGGMNITDDIAKSLSIAKERAEKMKISGQNFFEVNSALHFPALDSVVSEIGRVAGVASRNGDKIDAIILSGGTSKLPGLIEFFEKRTNIKTIIGNPFSRVEYDSKLEPIIENMSSHFSVSVGLALKGIENMKKNK